MDAIRKLISRIFGKNIAGILGIIGVAIPLVKEFVVVGMRIASIFLPRFEKYIDKVTGVFIKIEKAWDNIKRFFLDEDPNPIA